MAELSNTVENIRLDGESRQAGLIVDAYAQYAEDQPGDTLAFYEIEGQILALWDKLNELKLEIAVLETRTVELPVSTSDVDVNAAEMTRLLESFR